MYKDEQSLDWKVCFGKWGHRDHESTDLIPRLGDPCAEADGRDVRILGKVHAAGEPQDGEVVVQEGLHGVFELLLCYETPYS